VKPEPSFENIKSKFVGQESNFQKLISLIQDDELVNHIYLDDEGKVTVQTKNNEISKLQQAPNLEKTSLLMKNLKLIQVSKQWTAEEPGETYFVFRLWDNSIPTFDPQREKGLLFSKDLSKSIFSISTFPDEKPEIRFVENSDVMPVDGKVELILLTEVQPYWWVYNFRHRKGVR